MATYGRFLERVETRLSLADWMGRAALVAMSFGVPAWAAHATDWLRSYGPIAWVAAGAIGMVLITVLVYVSSIAYSKIQNIRLMSKISRMDDVINPMDQVFNAKRINLKWFVPPSGDAVENKTFIKCEILGSLNIIPFACTIMKSIYVSSDYIMVTDKSLIGGKIKNGHSFRNCTFSECKFHFVSFLISELAFLLFNSMGGCNWITHTPADQLTFPVMEPKSGRVISDVRDLPAAPLPALELPA